MDIILQNMDSEKRNRIINSSIKEFANYSYNKASTNNIVKNAGISKGLLFHYFGSKKELYEKLIGFVLNKLYVEVSDQINYDEIDFFDRIRQIMFLKIQISKTYPNMMAFIVNVIKEKADNNIEKIILLYKEYGIDVNEVMGKVYSYNINYSRFRDQAIIDKSINIITWTLEKYAETVLQGSSMDSTFNFEKCLIGMDEYISVLRKAFY